MRRWTLTLALGVAAIGANYLAPRLVGSVLAPPTLVEESGKNKPVIEIQEPVETTLDDFWIDTVDCGMG